MPAGRRRTAALAGDVIIVGTMAHLVYQAASKMGAPQCIHGEERTQSSQAGRGELLQAPHSWWSYGTDQFSNLLSVEKLMILGHHLQMDRVSSLDSGEALGCQYLAIQVAQEGRPWEMLMTSFSFNSYSASLCCCLLVEQRAKRV